MDDAAGQRVLDVEPEVAGEDLAAGGRVGDQPPGRRQVVEGVGDDLAERRPGPPGPRGTTPVCARRRARRAAGWTLISGFPGGGGELAGDGVGAEPDRGVDAAGGGP